MAGLETARQTLGEIAIIDQYLGTEVAIGKAIHRLADEIGFQDQTREKLTRKPRESC